MPIRGVVVFALLLLVIASARKPRTAHSADRLILRNLDIVADRTVVSLDEDGLTLDKPRLAGGLRVTWDEIERGTVAREQSRFDQLLAELGLPLFRIRQRLKTGDYEALAEPAELVYPRFAARKSQTAYMVCQATMWSRLAGGRREAAVEPYLRCYELLRSKAAHAGELPGKRRLNVDEQTAMSSDLAPIWFDAQAAKAVLAGVQAVVREMPQPRPIGAFVYYASLAIAAGERVEAERVIKSVPSGDQAETIWRDIVLAQQDLAASAGREAINRLRRASLPEAARPAALYCMGLADSQSADEAEVRDGILALLRLPAEHSRDQPELAAAGLYQAAAALDKLKDGRGAVAVRGELVRQFPGTYFGAKLRGEHSDPKR